ncbi:MAG: ammonia-forming cytochrome c nitrite reductase subunit c552 [Deltaproteobacteria bacterium]|nr:ammonia-forming cytochrome c nitrite reductase subunit c552 [Deltaproteobacteria bacterium]
MTTQDDTPIPSKPKKPSRVRAVAWLVLAAILGAAAAVGGTALLVNIAERKDEGRNPFFRVVELREDTENPAVWGQNFPQQFDAYRRTVDQVRTRFGGSEAVPRTPTAVDPRSVVAQSRLDEDPRLRVMWAGYAFSRDFREERGHAFMLTDQTFTERQRVVRQPGTCVHCHASTTVAYRRLGNGDATRGFEALNRMPYSEARQHVRHPITCIDCHDPRTLALRVTRPAFIEGMRALRRDPSYDPNTQATRQEMRTYVCAQCHVEYYFRGPEKRLVYPWANGQRADQILAFYDEVDFRDWLHADTGAPTLKAQHPEFEMYSQGIHARAGVACADCHMPYRRVGAMKISDHHVRSPLLQIEASCQPCHRVPEAELRGRAEAIQERTMAMRGRALDVIVELIGGLRDARSRGVSDDLLREPRLAQRRAQFLLDFVEAENSSGFHAPGEAARVLFLSLDHAHRGLRALPRTNGAGAAVAPSTPTPDADAGASADPIDAGATSADSPDAGATADSPDAAGPTSIDGGAPD